MWQADEGFRLARSRNRAIAAARGEYVIIVDGDMVLHRHFIADHARAARHGAFIQGVRLLTGPRIAGRMLEHGRLDIGFFAPDIKRRRHTVRRPAAEQVGVLERKGQRAIRGCNQAYWKSDLIRVNGFNEAFVGWGREDNEIAARLYNAGISRRNLKSRHWRFICITRCEMSRSGSATMRSCVPPSMSAKPGVHWAEPTC